MLLKTATFHPINLLIVVFLKDLFYPQHFFCFSLMTFSLLLHLISTPMPMTPSCITLFILITVINRATDLIYLLFQIGAEKTWLFSIPPKLNSSVSLLDTTFHTTVIPFSKTNTSNLHF